MTLFFYFDQNNKRKMKIDSTKQVYQWQNRFFDKNEYFSRKCLSIKVRENESNNEIKTEVDQSMTIKLLCLQTLTNVSSIEHFE